MEDQSERVIFFEGQIQKKATVRYVLVGILDAYKTYKPASTSSHSMQNITVIKYKFSKKKKRGVAPCPLKFLA